ncbi:Transducin family protein / WD-40 repeat family protein isoform 8 [Hibiscus syriacus]|uniref:Transducin family protein / WD-40 repeat family protein isoform 8 n=1 Tax=Hibiscus syriacus TaxID=106335 RepID=A0A6A3C2F4_HIBSY|nr:Transducin family protein / WD-40 repeat family protein isoform 8 [Hibiscus syriacus]
MPRHIEAEKLWQMMRHSSVRIEDLNAPSTYSSRRTREKFLHEPNGHHGSYGEKGQRAVRIPTGQNVKQQEMHDLIFFPGILINFIALQWGCRVEAESMRHFSAKYCPLVPPLRSTIAAALNPDGKTLLHSHGDHTVKIIDCQTGNCLKVLSGHRRTTWAVRFHPLYPEILASGILDHEVRLWNANSAECIGTRDFYRPIASIAFHAQGEVLAVTSGHKVRLIVPYMRGETSSLSIILKTRRSLRAVHFHSYAAPFLLTAEVNDLDAPDSSMTVATSPGYLRYPAPTVYLANDQSNLTNELPLMSLPFMIWPSFSRDNGRTSLQNTDGDIGSNEETGGNPLPTEMETDVSHSAMETMEVQSVERTTQFFPFGDPTSWELPFLQGWLIGQTQAGQRNMHLATGGGHENSFQLVKQELLLQIQSELATSLAETAAAELPCTVQLRIWLHDMKDPCAFLDSEKCRLTIPHAVLCSEMGAHFFTLWEIFSGLCCLYASSFRHLEVDPGVQSQLNSDIVGVATSPTRHPVLAHRVMYELRIYSLEEAT